MEEKNAMYVPAEHEAEEASNSYLMSLLALMAGLPLPVVNLIATLIFFLGNRKSTYFVRWHCTQALLSQCSIFLVNSFGFYWTLNIIFGSLELSNQYIAYLITLFLFNGAEFIVTIYTAIQTRKGNHVQWWLYGPITDQLCHKR